MRVCVVGHVEWVEFARVDHVPSPGEIVQAIDTWEEAAGGAAVAAVQLVNLGAEAHLFTALGADDLGRRAHEQLVGQGVHVHSGASAEAQRRAFAYVDSAGERTITVLGEKLLPRGDDATLPWEQLDGAEAAYFVSGDVAALRQARRAAVLVASARELATLVRGGVALEALVRSAEDSAERFEAGQLEPAPAAVVTTSGALGGWMQPGGPFRAAPVPGQVADTYGCGDCFAAGLAFGLGAGQALAEAVPLAARCGAAVLTGRGPYRAQFRG